MLTTQIGLRNIKTSLSVVLCILLFQGIHRPYPFYACIAAVICTQSTVDQSFKSGMDRLIGTAIGGFLGMFLCFLQETIPFFVLHALLTGIGIMLTIFICNAIGRNGACSIGCIVISAIMTNLKDVPYTLYAFNRMLDTFIGIIIALLINKYFFARYSKEQEKLNDIPR